MSGEILTIIGVGLALAGLQWRMHAALKADLTALNGRMDRLETRLDARLDRIENRIDALQAEMANVKERLAAVEVRVEAMQADVLDVKERLAALERGATA